MGDKQAREASLVVDEDAVHVTSVFDKSHEHAVVLKDATMDEMTLGALGYKQGMSLLDWRCHRCTYA